MGLTMHLLKADARRFVPLIAAWIGITIVSTLLQGVDHMVARGAHRPDASTRRSTAFWMTRPFPSGALLASRLLLVSALLVGVPAICDVVLMACYRVRPADAAGVLLESSLGRAVWTMAVMAAAAWTATFVRFVLLCGAVLVAASVLLNAGLMIALSTRKPAGAFLTVSTHGSEGLISPVTDQTGAVLAGAILLATGTLLLRVMYRTRSSRRSVVIGVTGWLAACLVAVAWPWPMLQADGPLTAWAAAASDVRLEAQPESVILDYCR